MSSAIASEKLIGIIRKDVKVSVPVIENGEWTTVQAYEEELPLYRQVTWNKKLLKETFNFHNEDNRDIKDEIVIRFSREMENGTFDDNGPDLPCFDMQPNCITGQKRALAAFITGYPWRTKVMFGKDRKRAQYACDKGQPRIGTADKKVSFPEDIKDLTGFEKSIIDYIVKSNGVQIQLTEAEYHVLYRYFKQEARLICSLVKGIPINKAPIKATILKALFQFPKKRKIILQFATTLGNGQYDKVLGVCDAAFLYHKFLRDYNSWFTNGGGSVADTLEILTTHALKNYIEGSGVKTNFFRKMIVKHPDTLKLSLSQKAREIEFFRMTEEDTMLPKRRTIDINDIYNSMKVED
jgi:hypothetical protein